MVYRDCRRRLNRAYIIVNFWVVASMERNEVILTKSISCDYHFKRLLQSYCGWIAPLAVMDVPSWTKVWI